MTRWQREWERLSKKSRDLLRAYAGADPSMIRTMRAGMFYPVHTLKQLRRWDRLDELVFESALKHNPDIRVISSRCGPHAVRLPRSEGYIGMPKDPVKWALLGGYWDKRDLEPIKGTFKRNTLEHEYAELKLFRVRSKKTAYGKHMRSFKSIQSAQSHHNGVHPLIAELNVSGKCRYGIEVLRIDWQDQPGQNQVFPLLKQFGWTPCYGIPTFGKLSDKIQRRVEELFAPHFQTLISSKIRRIERKYKGRALKRKKEEVLYGATQYAGGKGLRRKYLK